MRSLELKRRGGVPLNLPLSKSPKRLELKLRGGGLLNLLTVERRIDKARVKAEKRSSIKFTIEQRTERLELKRRGGGPLN